MSKTDHDNANDLSRDAAYDDDDSFDRHDADADNTRDEDDAQDAAGRDADDDTDADERSRPPQLWLVASCVCLFAAAVLWLRGNADAAFVVAALGVLAWFFNVRAQLRKK